MANKKRSKINHSIYGIIFCIPFIVTFLFFSLYPTILTFVLGFTDAKGITPTDFNFLAEPFENFKIIFNNQSFRKALVNTVRIWLINFIPQIVLALVLTEWFTNARRRVKGQGFFKVIFYMPNIITAATIAILFNALFGYPMGPINDVLVSTGILDSAVYFFQSKTATQLIVAFIQFWMWYGYTMIILISGVLGINPELFEAAAIDGANNLQTFFRVTLPNLKTILLYTLITSLIGGLQMYDIPQLLNLGRPDESTLTTSMFIYNQAFTGQRFYNRASAASMIMFVIIGVASAFIFFIMRDKSEAKIAKAERLRLKEYNKKNKGGNK